MLRIAVLILFSPKNSKRKTTFAKKMGNAVYILHTYTFISSKFEINVKIELFRAE